MSDKESYEGREIEIRFDSTLCIHSRMCVLGHPGVFRPNVEGEWIDPDAAPVADIVEIAHACPSGAISYHLREPGERDERPPVVNLLRIRENGPYAIHADVALDGEAGRYRITLCRCGASRNKPYCDGNHTVANFTATGEPESRDTEQMQDRGGSLKISPTENGPLEFAGPLEIVSGTGRTIDRRASGFLCRCGASKNKPYCDGSHVNSVFKAPGRTPAKDQGE